MSHYELLLFDADATLFDFNRASVEAFRETMEQLNVPEVKTTFELYLKISRKLWNMLEEKKINIQTLQIERYALLFKELGLAYSPEDTNKLYLEHLAARPYLIDKAKEVIQRVALAHRMAIVTNGIAAVQYSRLANSELRGFFKCMFISGEIGYAKPDKRYFDYVFSKMAPMNPRKTLVIGDSLTADIKGGNDSGVHTCWFNPLKATNTTGIKPTYEIHSLEELYDIV